MREIDFLPAWYPKVRRQRTLLRIQTWASMTLIAAGACVILSLHQKAHAARERLDDSREHASKMIKAVRQLDEMLSLQQQLMTKQKIVSELGLPVELGRVVSELAACMPNEVSFTDLDVKTVEGAPVSIADRAARGGRPAGVSRQLHVRVKGVAPTEAEVTTFWSRLIQRPFMQQVRLVTSIERVNGEHRMREFEITLSIPLDFQLGA